jgi:hypothetical protein
MPRIQAMFAARLYPLFRLAVSALLMIPGSSIGQDKVRFPISVASKTDGFVPVWAVQE